jgi:hypothetical protein
VHLVGYFHSCITMHGFMNIKSSFVVVGWAHWWWICRPSSLNVAITYEVYEFATLRGILVGRDSSVGSYGLDGHGIKSLGSEIFPHLSRLALGPTQSPVQCAPVPFPGGKAAGAWLWSPTPSSAEVNETVELCLYSPSGPSVDTSRMTFTWRNDNEG